MADVSISEAIALFDHSETARGAKGGVGKWPLRVLEALWGLYRGGEVGYGELPPDARGGYKENVPGFDLRLNPDYIKRLPKDERLPFVSLVLVHEGVHATGILANSKGGAMALR